RGLRPVTLEDYRHRVILEPYRFVARGMLNQAGMSRNEAERSRLSELAGIVDPDDANIAQMRVTAYLREAHDLWQAKAARTIVKMFDAVGPVLTDIAGRRARDPGTMELVAWAGWYYADSLEVVGRGDEAIAMTDSLLDHFDDGWKDAANL